MKLIKTGVSPGDVLVICTSSQSDKINDILHGRIVNSWISHVLSDTDNEDIE